MRPLSGYSQFGDLFMVILLKALTSSYQLPVEVRSAILPIFTGDAGEISRLALK